MVREKVEIQDINRKQGASSQILQPKVEALDKSNMLFFDGRLVEPAARLSYSCNQNQSRSQLYEAVRVVSNEQE